MGYKPSKLDIGSGVSLAVGCLLTIVLLGIILLGTCIALESL